MSQLHITYAQVRADCRLYPTVYTSIHLLPLIGNWLLQEGSTHVAIYTDVQGVSLMGSVRCWQLTGRGRWNQARASASNMLVDKALAAAMRLTVAGSHGEVVTYCYSWLTSFAA